MDRLEDIAAPTPVLVGGDDEEAIRAQGVLLERRLADARQITVPMEGIC